MFTDIRRFDRDQSAMRKTLLEQKAILENAAVGIVFSKDQVIRECNIRASEIFGYDTDEMIGLGSVTVFPTPAHYAHMGVDAGPCLASGHPFSSEQQLRRKDGSLLWCRVHGRAVDPQHGLHGTVWIIEDIDESHHNEAKLRRAVLEMQAIMDNAPLAIAFQRDNSILRYNKQFSRYFGFDADTGIGHHGRELFASGAEYDALLHQALPLLRAGMPFQTDVRMLRQDGSSFWAYAYVYAINAGHGAPERPRRPRGALRQVRGHRGAGRGGDPQARAALGSGKARGA